MGGLFILPILVLSTLIFADWHSPWLWYTLWIVVTFGLIGCWDDYQKVVHQNSKGLPGRWKLFWQFVSVSAVLGAMAVSPAVTIDPSIYWPHGEGFTLGYVVYAILVYGVIIGSSNAVNLTDGLDGLAIVPAMLAISIFGFIAYIAGDPRLAWHWHVIYVPGAQPLIVFAAAMVGVGCGFLWFNIQPAKIFMGDTASLSIGGAMGVMAMSLHQEVLLLLVGGLFVLEAISVMLQVGYFKATKGKRIFKMAPLHHHFELSGWSVPQVTIRAWLLSVLLGILGLAILGAY